MFSNLEERILRSNISTNAIYPSDFSEKKNCVIKYIFAIIDYRASKNQRIELCVCVCVCETEALYFELIPLFHIEILIRRYKKFNQQWERLIARWSWLELISPPIPMQFSNSSWRGYRVIVSRIGFLRFSFFSFPSNAANGTNGREEIPNRRCSPTKTIFSSLWENNSWPIWRKCNLQRDKRSQTYEILVWSFVMKKIHKNPLVQDYFFPRCTK